MLLGLLRPRINLAERMFRIANYFADRILGFRHTAILLCYEPAVAQALGSWLD